MAGSILRKSAQMAMGGYVHGLCASRDGGLWVLNDGRLRKWKDRAWVADLGNTLWGNALVDTFLETRTGWLVAGTASSGLFCLPSGSPRANRSTSAGQTSSLPTGLSRPARTAKVGCGSALAVAACNCCAPSVCTPPFRLTDGVAAPS